MSEKEEWWLGRLEPQQTARLALPQFGFASTSQAVAVAVVPGWSTDAKPRRNPHAALSMDEVSDNLPGEEWIFVNGQVQGPMRASSHGQHRP